MDLGSMFCIRRSFFTPLLLGGEKPWERGWNLLLSCNVPSSKVDIFKPLSIFFANFQVTPFLDSSSYLVFVLCTPKLTAVVTASMKARTMTKLYTN